MPLRTITRRSEGAGGNGHVSAGPDFGEGTHQINLSAANLVASGVSTDYLSGKDTWIDNVVACPVDIARQGSDLQLEGIIATKKDVWFAWDLSTLPAGAIVSAATLKLNVKTAAAVGAASNLNHIPNANETWDEATLRCSTGQPIALTSFQTAVASTFETTGEKSFALNATARSRIESRMGTGFYTIVVTTEATATNSIFESADEGVDNNLGPRLSLAWSKTIEA